MNVDELSLVGMWDEVVKVSGIQEQDAYLHSFRLDTDYEGRVYISDFVFKTRNNESDWTLYGVRFDNENGEFLINTGKAANNRSTYNPRVLFAEIDKLGLAELQSTSSSFSIKLQPEYYSPPPYSEENGYFEYTASPDLLLYRLADGELTPLKYVKIGYDQSYLSVRVQRIMWSSKSSGLTGPAQQPPEIWFLAGDIDKAEMVEDRQNWRGPEYRVFVSGIQSVLPEGWKLRVIDWEGGMDPPHGLNEPLFRVDFIDPTHEFENQGGMRYPSLRLYFYDIQEKDTVLKTIEQEKMFSWDVPAYFDETTQYIIVTSPLYINGGVFTDQAMKLYSPLETALKNFFCTALSHTGYSGRSIDDSGNRALTIYKKEKGAL